jgi:uncharacterized membrane protein
MRKPTDARPAPSLASGRAEAQAVSRLAALLRPTRSERVIIRLARLAGGSAFVNFNLLWIGCWLTVNAGLVPGLQPFDPFPFRLLRLILPAEALLLVILVGLNRARHSNRMARLRRLFDTLISEGDAPGATRRAGRAACPPGRAREI